MTAGELRRQVPCLYELLLLTGRRFHESESWDLRDTDDLGEVPADLAPLERTASAMDPDEIAGITDGSSSWYHRHMDRLDDVRPGLSDIDAFLLDYFY